MDRRQFLAATTAAAAASQVPAFAAAEPERVEVVIHPREVTGPLPHIWEECVGSDRAAITLRESWRQDIDQARNELGIKRVRFHGILNDELGVGTQTIQRQKALPPNFRNVAEVYDGLVERNLTPFVELSFMPSALASGQAAFGFYRGNISPPKSFEEWGAFIREFGLFLVDRYGLNQVAQWPIEVWNEANLPFFWSGNQADYFRLYKTAATALKSIDPRLRVGGPATSSAEWIPEFLAFCQAENAPVDFVSTHIYAGDNQAKLFGPGAAMSQNAVIPEAVRRTKAKIAGSTFPQLPLYIDEWSSDSPAMIAHVLSGVLGQADMMSQWVLSGTYEELGPTDYLLQEGAMGWAQMVRGVPRPSYNTYRLLHALGNRRLQAEGPALASRRADGSLAAVVWNLAEVVQPAGIPGANSKRDVLGSPKQMSVSLPTLRPGQPIRLTYVDQTRGSPLPAWRAMGSPKLPTMRQIETLRRSARLAAPEVRRIGPDNRIEIMLPPEGVVLIEA